MPTGVSNGESTLISLRVPNELLAWVDERVKWSEANRRDGAYTRTGFLVALIEEGRSKRERSKRSRKKSRVRVSESVPPSE
ncbi:MAG TPA: hypothetical protein VGE74_12370 [Gemmata sp.]